MGQVHLGFTRECALSEQYWVRPHAQKVADHIEQRLRTWRQQQMNCSGDRLALDDFMGEESIDDLVDFVCDEYALDALPKLTHEQACALHTMLDHYGNDSRMRCLVELLPENMRRDFGA